MKDDQEHENTLLRQHDENADEGWFWIGTVAAFFVIGAVFYSLSGNDRTLVASSGSVMEQGMSPRTTLPPAQPPAPL